MSLFRGKSWCKGLLDHLHLPLAASINQSLHRFLLLAVADITVTLHGDHAAAFLPIVLFFKCNKFLSLRMYFLYSKLSLIKRCQSDVIINLETNGGF